MYKFTLPTRYDWFPHTRSRIVQYSARNVLTKITPVEDVQRDLV